MLNSWHPSLHRSPRFYYYVLPVNGLNWIWNISVRTIIHEVPSCFFLLYYVHLFLLYCFVLFVLSPISVALGISILVFFSPKIVTMQLFLCFFLNNLCQIKSSTTCLQHPIISIFTQDRLFSIVLSTAGSSFYALEVRLDKIAHIPTYRPGKLAISTCTYSWNQMQCMCALSVINIHTAPRTFLRPYCPIVVKVLP